MSHSYIVTIFADALDKASHPDFREKTTAELGLAIINLCTDVSYYYNKQTKKRKTSHRFGNTQNGVNFCDDPHHSDTKLYIWSGNRLEKLQNLSTDEFQVVENLIEKEKEYRLKHK